MTGTRPTFAVLKEAAWEAAPAVLGWTLETLLAGEITAVALTEVEAYDQSDPASHSFRGPSVRTATMFGPPGRLYVYRSYGLHWCANVSTGPVGHGAAVLIRAGVPVAGRRIMERRRGRNDHLADGPGKLCQALGIEGTHDGVDLTVDGPIRLVPGELAARFRTTPRIGISRGTEALWRFVAEGPVGEGL